MSDLTTARRPGWVRVLLLVLSAVLIVIFVMLGNWQMRRLAWKLDLIDAVESRAFAAPVALPQNYDPDDHAYLRVTLDGTYPVDDAVLVKAVTELGPGYWVMVPLQTPDALVWINRGFVPPERKSPQDWTPSPTTITGLIRPNEPGGTLLERNDPANNRWVSRDTGAMSRAVQVDHALPYFVDADHGGAPDGWPRGGLTIVQFRNTHLSYALTWYAMAVLFAAALVYIALRGNRADPDD